MWKQSCGWKSFDVSVQCYWTRPEDECGAVFQKYTPRSCLIVHFSYCKRNTSLNPLQPRFLDAALQYPETVVAF